MARALPLTLAPARPRDLVAGLVGTGSLLLLLAFVVWPVVAILKRSVVGDAGFTAAHLAEVVASPRLARILLNSLVVSAVSTAITVTVAFFMAFAVARTTIPWKGFISSMSVIPLVAPPFVVSLAFILLFGRNGLVTAKLLGATWSIYGFHGIVATMVFTYLPHAYLILVNVLANMDPALEEAAENLGAGRLRVLGRVTLAMARPGLASAFLIVFIFCLTDFGNPILVGGRYNVLATEIYSEVIGMSNFESAATMSIALLVPSLAAYGLNSWWVGGKSYVSVKGGTRPGARPTPPLVRWTLFGLAVGVAGFVFLIYALIPVASVVAVWGHDWSLTTRHYDFESTVEGAAPILNSLKLATLAGLLGTALSLLLAYLIERKRPVGWRALEALSLLPAAIPGTVLGLGYVIAFNVPPLLLTGTLWIVVLSVVFLKLPVGVLAGVSALKQIDPALEEAATSLGAGGVTAFVRVVLPLLKGVAFSIFIYLFIQGMVTLSAVVFLIYPGFNLGSVAILAQVENGYIGVACALATILLGIVLAAVALLRAVVGGGDRVAVISS
jgi:iron(III) transport system permease protein